jgi:DNA-binding NtrC family response regulator
MGPCTNEPVNVLAILREGKNVFAEQPGEWRLRFAHDFEEAEAILQEGSIEIVVSDYRIDTRHSWRDLLQERSAVVIVVDRNADEAMWVEVLADGAFDLLRKPLDTAEVDRALSAACRTIRKTQAAAA